MLDFGSLAHCKDVMFLVFISFSFSFLLFLNYGDSRGNLGLEVYGTWFPIGSFTDSIIVYMVEFLTCSSVLGYFGAILNIWILLNIRTGPKV